MKTAQNTLRETSQYECFKYSPDQRDIKTSHVRDLMDSMKTWGFLPSKPVQVYQEGKKYVVVDGHHRLVAAKNLQIPVIFVVESKSHCDAIGQVNGFQRKWQLANFVNMYAKRGIADYQELAEYVRLGIPVSTAASFLGGFSSYNSGTSTSNTNKSLMAGTFKIKTRQKIEIIASFLRGHGHENKAYANRHFIAAFDLLMRVPEFDFSKLANKLANNPKALAKTATTDQMLDQIEEIYNYHQSIKVNISFLAKQAKTTRGVNIARAKSNQ